MKRTSYLLVVVFLSITIGCRDKDPGLRFAENTGLNLYWHHTALPEKGRGLVLSFTSAKAQRDEYEFKFDYKIRGQEILITLQETLHKGKCQEFPGSWGNECTSRGDIFISESELSQGQYKFIVEVNDQKVISTFTIDAEKYTLQIPGNGFFNSHITSVYPAPKNLIFGSIGYFGMDNKHLADTLIANFEKLGLTGATIPDHPYSDLGGSSIKHLKTDFWEPNNFSVAILLHLNSADVRTVFEMVRKYHALTDKKLRIGLYSSNNMEQLLGGPNSELN